MSRLDTLIDQLIHEGHPVPEAIQIAIDPDPAPVIDEHAA